MVRQMFTALAAVVVLLPLAATPQEKPQVRPVPAGGDAVARVEDQARPVSSGAPVARMRDSRQLYEDVEVMRHLLSGTLDRLTQAGQTTCGAGVAVADVDSDGWLDLFVAKAARPERDEVRVYKARPEGKFEEVHLFHNTANQKASPPAVEGSYLRGYGVVFSATLPMHFWTPVEAGARPSLATPSAWDRAQKELRGEKVAGAPPTATRQLSLVDVLVRVLAENGHHFGQLADDERLAVAITLRADQCASCHQQATVQWGTPAAAGPGDWNAPPAHPGLPGPVGGGAPAGRNATPSLVGEPGGMPSPPTSTDVTTAVTGGGPGAPADGLSGKEHDQVLLGDLHLKQGRHREAVAAYTRAAESIQKAAERQPKEATMPARATLDRQLGVVEVYTKLAQAQVAAGEPLAAAKTFQRIAEASRNMEKIARQEQKPHSYGADGKPATGIRLPSKLVVSVSKRTLDQLAAREIGFEDFAKAVSVDYQSFPDPR